MRFLAALRLLIAVFVAAALTTVVLSLDATVALAVPLLRGRAVSLRTLILEANPAFCAFVFALGIVVLRRVAGDVAVAADPARAGRRAGNR